MTADDERNEEESNGGGGHHLGRFAAVAAASGATALAARKAYTALSSDEPGEAQPRRERRSRAGGNTSTLVRESLTSGWNVARDAVVPLVEDAAERAGGYLAERAPEVIRDVVVPKFIAGFEQARDSSSGGTKEAA
jgi:hypothetical protein